MLMLLPSTIVMLWISDQMSWGWGTSRCHRFCACLLPQASRRKSQHRVDPTVFGLKGAAAQKSFLLPALFGLLCEIDITYPVSYAITFQTEIRLGLHYAVQTVLEMLSGLVFEVLRFSSYLEMVVVWSDLCCWCVFVSTVDVLFMLLSFEGDEEEKKENILTCCSAAGDGPLSAVAASAEFAVVCCWIFCCLLLKLALRCCCSCRWIVIATRWQGGRSHGGLHRLLMSKLCKINFPLQQVKFIFSASSFLFQGLCHSACAQFVYMYVWRTCCGFANIISFRRKILLQRLCHAAYA